MRGVFACEASQEVILEAKKHLDPARIEGSSGAVDGRNAWHLLGPSPISSTTNVIASELVIASIEVALHARGPQVDEQDAPGEPRTHPLVEGDFTAVVAIGVGE